MQEVQALKEYTQCLEKELQSKAVEQETLYRALENAEREFEVLDELYRSKAELKAQVAELKEALQARETSGGQIFEVVAELEWSRRELLTLNEQLEDLQNELQTEFNRCEQLEYDNSRLRERLVVTEQNSHTATV
jgi:chromosome segregation ATPase